MNKLIKNNNISKNKKTNKNRSSRSNKTNKTNKNRSPVNNKTNKTNKNRSSVSNKTNKNRNNKSTKNISNNKSTKKINNKDINKKSVKGGALVNIQPGSKLNPFFNKSNGQGIMRLNNYLCFKEDKLNDFSDMVYELFFRRIQEKSMFDDVDRRVNLDLPLLKSNTEAQKENDLNILINSNVKRNPVYK